MKIVALMLMALAGIAQAVEIGGNLGVSVTTWKPFDNGIDVEAFGDIAVLENRISIMPKAGYTMLTYRTEKTMGSMASTESGSSGYTHAAIAAMYWSVRGEVFGLGVGPELGLLYFGEHRGILDNKVSVPAEVRITASGQVRGKWNVAEYFGIDVGAKVGYTPETNLNVDRVTYAHVRPFVDYVLLQLQIGAYYRFGKRQ